jgi:hypothetical protein
MPRQQMTSRVARDDESSSPGEFHPQALSDPDRRLSPHPALLVRSPAISRSARGPADSGRVAPPDPTSGLRWWSDASTVCISSTPIRRQTVPDRDEFCQARIGADIARPLASTLDATIMLRNDFRNLGAGCNSRVPDLRSAYDRKTLVVRQPRRLILRGSRASLSRILQRKGQSQSSESCSISTQGRRSADPRPRIEVNLGPTKVHHHKVLSFRDLVRQTSKVNLGRTPILFGDLSCKATTISCGVSPRSLRGSPGSSFDISPYPTSSFER